MGVSTQMTEALPGTSLPAREGGAGSGLPSEQVHGWMETVCADLERVRARIDYLQLEEQRLEEQYRLLAQLLASSL
jgi:hypothetical protein